MPQRPSIAIDGGHGHSHIGLQVRLHARSVTRDALRRQAAPAALLRSKRPLATGPQLNYNTRRNCNRGKTAAVPQM